MSKISYCSGIIMSGFIGLSGIVAGCAKKEKATVAGPVRVEVEVVGSGDSRTTGRNYSGTVGSAYESTVSFSIPGTIKKVYVEEGQKVNKGQLLAQIGSENLINSQNIANAELAEARDAYQRLKKLHDANALPDIKWVEIQSKLEQAENAAELAGRAVGDASIYAPISGYVSRKFADDGQTVVPAEPIVKIVNLNKLQISISVPENDIASFGNATEAKVTFDVADNLTIKGKMGQKSVAADPLTRSYTVKFDLDDSGGKILPGMIGTVEVDAQPSDSTVMKPMTFTLPSQAVLLSADNRQFVWTVKDGKANRKYVVADELSADGVTVKSGLVPGDSVIVAGMQKVSTGTEVTAVR